MKKQLTALALLAALAFAGCASHTTRLSEVRRADGSISRSTNIEATAFLSSQSLQHLDVENGDAGQRVKLRGYKRDRSIRPGELRSIAAAAATAAVEAAAPLP